MRAFSRWLDRFCIRHPRFGVGNLMLYVVLGNAVVWLFSMMDTTGMLTSFLAFSPALIFRGQIWRLFTFALIPNSSGILTLLFLYFYYYIGSTLEREWGTVKFNVYFFSGLLFTVLYGLAIYLIFGSNTYLGANYIYLSMFFAFACLYPNQIVYLFGLIPLKIKWLAWIDAVYFLLDVVRLRFPLKLLPVVAVLNFLLFCGEDLFAPFRPSRMQQRQKTVHFKREIDRINAQRRAAPYRFRCEVCGRTDVTNPELDFRYCSRCVGYHCYCLDHIQSHQHFTQ